jgi:hypothetical protein
MGALQCLGRGFADLNVAGWKTVSFSFVFSEGTNLVKLTSRDRTEDPPSIDGERKPKLSPAIQGR